MSCLVDHRANVLLRRAPKKCGAQMNWRTIADYIGGPNATVRVIVGRANHGQIGRCQPIAHFADDLGYLIHVGIILSENSLGEGSSPPVPFPRRVLTARRGGWSDALE